MARYLCQIIILLEYIKVNHTIGGSVKIYLKKIELKNLHQYVLDVNQIVEKKGYEKFPE